MDGAFVTPRLKLFLRSFLVQASFNYERMTGVGLSFVVDPLLRESLGPEQYRAAKRRANGFFNAHPYMSALAGGALARAESDGLPEIELIRFKKALIGALGLFGDRLVWTGALPLLAALALVIGTMVGPWAGVLFFVFSYNVFHFWLRWWGAGLGLAHGIRVGTKVAGPEIRRLIGSVGPLAALMVGFSAPLVGDYIMSGWTLWDASGAVIIAFAGITAMRVMPHRIGSLGYGVFVVLVSLATGVLN